MAFPSHMYRDPAKIVEENELVAIRRARKPANPFEDVMTADELLRQWTKGEWDGPLPHPLPHRRCASAEGEYVTPSDMAKEHDPDDFDSSDPIQWAMHAHVDSYYRSLPLLDQRILQFEYTRRHQHFSGMNRNQRHEKASRLLAMSVHRYRNRLEHMKIEIETSWRGK